MITQAHKMIERQIYGGAEVTGYYLLQLASGSYDLLLGKEIIGSVVRCGARNKSTTWIVELLDDSPLARRPAPFVAFEEEFRTLEEVCRWLGGAPIRNPAGMMNDPQFASSGDKALRSGTIESPDQTTA